MDGKQHVIYGPVLVVLTLLVHHTLAGKMISALHALLARGKYLTGIVVLTISLVNVHELICERQFRFGAGIVEMIKMAIYNSGN